jgi:hypothetical protein
MVFDIASELVIAVVKYKNASRCALSAEVIGHK